MSMRQQVFGSLVWMAVSSLLTLTIAFGTSVALARLLAPADFALLAIAMIFISFSNILSEFGFGQALIQWPGEIKAALGTAFILNTVISLALSLLLSAAAPAIAAYFSAPEVTWVVRALGLNLVLSATGFVPSSLLERRMQFRYRARAEIGAQVIYAVVAVPLAWRGAGVWSLVVGTLMSSGVRSTLFWWAAGVRPVLKFDRQIASHLLRFGRHLVAISFILFSISRLDVFYLGRITTLAEVGYYGLAISITTLTMDLVGSLFGRVTFPVFSQLQHNLGQIGNGYLRAMSAASYATFPMIAGLLGVAPAAIVVIYGERWQPAVILTRILCLFALFRALSRLTGNVFTATGRPGTATQLAVLRLIVLVVLILLFGASRQTVGVAWAVSLSMVISGVWSVWRANRYLGISHRRFFSAIRPQLMAASGMGLIVVWIGQYLSHSLLALVALVVSGIVSYVSLLWVLDRAGMQRELQELWVLLRHRTRP